MTEYADTKFVVMPKAFRQNARGQLVCALVIPELPPLEPGHIFSLSAEHAAKYSIDAWLALGLIKPASEPKPKPEPKRKAEAPKAAADKSEGDDGRGSTR